MQMQRIPQTAANTSQSSCTTQRNSCKGPQAGAGLCNTTYATSSIDIGFDAKIPDKKLPVTKVQDQMHTVLSVTAFPTTEAQSLHIAESESHCNMTLLLPKQGVCEADGCAGSLGRLATLHVQGNCNRLPRIGAQ